MKSIYIFFYKKKTKQNTGLVKLLYKKISKDYDLIKIKDMINFKIKWDYIIINKKKDYHE